jgi:hypothetical protein
MLFLSVLVTYNAITTRTARNATISQVVAQARKKHKLTLPRPPFLTDSRTERENQAKRKMKDVEVKDMAKSQLVLEARVAWSERELRSRKTGYTQEGCYSVRYFADGRDIREAAGGEREA